MAKRVALYARVSTRDQDPESQLHALREYVSHRGFYLVEELVDHVTGDLAKRSRRKGPVAPAYQKLMELARKRKIDCVIVWKYDRFARSLKGLLDALVEFNALGIDFISYTQNVDTTTPSGRLFFHIIGSFAEFERELIVERVKAGLDKARARGKILGKKKDEDLERRVIACKKLGNGVRAIARELGVSPAGVSKILKRTGHTVITVRRKSAEPI
jgi:DNA invertase Pin-like site-specific DNA recombinase